MEEWGDEVKETFLNKFKQKIDQISTQPENCPKSEEFGGIYKCVVTKQTTFFDQVNPTLDEIEIITLFDTRQDPNSLKKDIL
ncbi:type II toxin-antitoxin system RelE/ParE family toxin [Gelidibacter mesophilus]|uniref:type II toxin-antitoxin system RelE/ParE family toxin n=1 Tax=Gelidibacter mesophilus TaxID=169050 RepID=UPI000417FF92|nr:type II toxin-antitoxin system RelE/ParE family toxin [Gelidibacter mesophilus]